MEKRITNTYCCKAFVSSPGPSMYRVALLHAPRRDIRRFHVMTLVNLAVVIATGGGQEQRHRARR